MERIKRNLPTLLSFITFLVLFFTALHAGSLEGKWILVEQRYESGSANILDQEKPVSLEVKLSGGHLTAKISVAGEKPAVYDWPAFVNDIGPLPLAIDERKEDLQKGTIAVRYRVKPSPDDDLVLAIVEEYSLAENENALVGKMEVTFMQGETKRGSFTLHRRFEKKS